MDQNGRRCSAGVDCRGRFGRHTQRDCPRDWHHRPHERKHLHCVEQVIRGCRVGGPDEGRRHGRLRGDKPRRRALLGAPVRVNQVPGEASVSGEQPPRIVLSSRKSGDPAILVLWTAKSPSGTRVLSARSTDGGKAFGPAESVPGSEGSGTRGWQSAAVTSEGGVVAVWLDHREVPARTAGAAANDAHQHGATSPRPAADGAARAQLSQIFAARLNEPASARAIAPGVCYCCKTSVAAGANGTVVAVWRHVYTGNIRDIALATSADGGRTFAPPARVSEDNWVLAGCPDNDPLSRSTRRMRST